MAIHDREWNSRPLDVSNLLNPAFLGVILRKSIDAYSKEREVGMPFELAFLVLPLVLHGDTRSKLPNTTATRLQPWLYEHREVLIDFALRAREIVPFARESMMFCVKHGIVQLRVSGHLIAGDASLRGVGPLETKGNEIRAIIRKSSFVGKWLSEAGPSTNIFASFGVKP